MSSNRRRHYSRSSSRERIKDDNSGSSKSMPKTRTDGREREPTAEKRNSKYRSSSGGTPRKYRASSPTPSSSSSCSYDRRRPPSSNYKRDKSRSVSASPSRLPQAYRREPSKRKDYPKAYRNGDDKYAAYKERKSREGSGSPASHKAKLPYFIDEDRERHRLETRYRHPTPPHYSKSKMPLVGERRRSYGRPRTPEEDERRYQTTHQRHRGSPLRRSPARPTRDLYDKEYRRGTMKRQYEDEQLYYKNEYNLAKAAVGRPRARSRCRSRSPIRIRPRSHSPSDSRERKSGGTNAIRSEAYSYERHEGLERQLANSEDYPYGSNQKTVISPQIIPVPVPVPTHHLYNGTMFPTVYGPPVMTSMPRYHPPHAHPGAGVPPMPRRMHPMPRLGLRMHGPGRMPFFRPRMPQQRMPPPSGQPRRVRPYWS